MLSKAGGAFPKLVLPFKFFAGGALGNGKQWLPWIHIDDEVRAIQFVLANEQADGPFNLAAPNPVTNRDMAKALGEVMGRPAVLPAPGFAMQSIFGEMSTLLLEGQRAIPKKLQELGFQFKYETVQAALRNLLGSEKHRWRQRSCRRNPAGAHRTGQGIGRFSCNIVTVLLSTLLRRKSPTFMPAL